MAAGSLRNNGAFTELPGRVQPRRSEMSLLTSWAKESPKFGHQSLVPCEYLIDGRFPEMALSGTHQG